MNFDTIKRNYDKGLWTIALVRMSVKKGFITEAQYKIITGNTY